MKSDKRVNCHKCKGFYITWDKNFPYGCRILGFKSKYLPSVEVYRSSGVKCMYFTQK
ncbi:uracil-DNA glycosylase [Deferribacter autotrophicus]|uniref:Uracil-DNA glycosylase n=1 Tax=Deferribacter autotrophicus TaxID=500465 RepID=A0A5A8F542_9BACT|nr:uracil-DNA glycosylase [Deferribacter autotrophicus]